MPEINGGRPLQGRGRGGLMPEIKRQKERLVVMLVIGIIALNYPLLSLASRVQLLFGIPVLYLYLFAVWSFFILCLALIIEKPTAPSLTASSQKQEKSA